MEDLVYPIILSGGLGTRLWPLSRRLCPKQFLGMRNPSSLFAQTLARVNSDSFAAPSVICNEDHRFLVAEELRHANITPADIILEPTARNTAPAIAVAALRLVEHNVGAVMLVLPSDHMIKDTAIFQSKVKAAVELVADDYLVMFGVTPSYPETGYGYIRQGEALGDNCWKVAGFVEKPDQNTAEGYLQQGGYFWNAGIFVFGAQMFLDKLYRYHPEIVTAARQALLDGQPDLDFFRLNKAAFRAAPAISVDSAVMEKTDRAAMLPLSTGWNDIGSWASLWAMGDADADGNVTEGNTIILDANDNYIHSEKPLIAALGVNGLIIVATDDTVLVLPKSRAQEVKDVVAALDASGHEEAVSHTRVYRPWGHYQNLEGDDGFLVKRIVVNPGAKLSLQYHHKRAEHWIVVAGTARVTKGDEVFDLRPNQSTYIPQGALHRLENPGDAPLHLIEVQSGDYIGEDDIIRLEDTFGRN